MTANEATKVISVLTAAYPNTQISKETISIYARFLADLSYEMGQAVVLKLISSNKFFPSIAGLREAATKMLPEEIPDAEQAWAEVVNQIKCAGIYRNPSFNPLISKAVKALGGWRNLCMSDNQAADRAHFFRIYESYRQREIEDKLQLPEIKMLKGKIKLQLEDKK